MAEVSGQGSGKMVPARPGTAVAAPHLLAWGTPGGTAPAG